MDAPRAINPLRPMRDVHPARNAVVLALLALVMIGVAVVWWDNKDAAQSITDAVYAWRAGSPETGAGTASPGLPARTITDQRLLP